MDSSIKLISSTGKTAGNIQFSLLQSMVFISLDDSAHLQQSSPSITYPWGYNCDTSPLWHAVCAVTGLIVKCSDHHAFSGTLESLDEKKKSNRGFKSCC